MKTQAAVILGGLLAAAAALYALWLYPALPEQIPVHWNINGEVDGWGAKHWAAFLMPALMLLLVGMSIALPSLSPRPFTVESFRGTFNYLMLVVVALFGYLQVVMLQAALHPEAASGRLLMGGLLLFLGLMGNVLGKVRRNFWMGIRTPWTLADDRVWNATHRLAARLLVGAGFLGVLALWLGAPALLCFWLLMAALLVPAVYSFFLSKRLEGEGGA